MKIIVTGSRWAQGPLHYERIAYFLGLFAEVAHVQPPVDADDIPELLVGDAPGVDALAAIAADHLNMDLSRFEANWDAPCRETCRHGPRKVGYRGGGPLICPAAGNYRNQDMVDTGPHLGLAFPLIGHPNRGTEDCITRIRRAGIPLFIYPLQPGRMPVPTFSRAG